MSLICKKKKKKNCGFLNVMCMCVSLAPYSLAGLGLGEGPGVPQVMAVNSFPRAMN